MDKQQLIHTFLSAKTNQEVNDIVNKNIEFLNTNPEYFICARNARRRIHRIHREMLRSWQPLLN